MTTLSKFLNNHNTFGEFTTWVGDQNIKQTWEQCQRGDWLLFLAYSLKVDRKLATSAACLCAREVLYLFEDKHPGDLRPRKALETAEAWVRGEASEEEVREATKRAHDAAAKVFALSDTAYTASGARTPDTYFSPAAYAADAASVSCAVQVTTINTRICHYYDTAHYASSAHIIASSDPEFNCLLRTQVLAHYADLVRSVLSVEVVKKAWEAL